MASGVITVGREPDPAKRLRQAWGRSIRTYRRVHGLTLEQLAGSMDPPVTAAAVSSWETGKTAPRWHHQIAVARALGVPHALLFAITDEVA